MPRMEGTQNNEVIILEHIEKLESDLATIKKQVAKEPLTEETIDRIFQDVYATGWPAPHISEDDIKFVRAIERAHRIFGD